MANIILFHKRGIGGTFGKVLISMFEKANWRVRWNNELSDEIKSEFGVLQGGIISPKLFTEYLSDIGSYLDNSKGIVLGELLMYYLLYADDLALCSDSAEGLQKQLDGLLDFCKKWHLIVNLSKTKVLVFNRRNVREKFYYDGQEIERSDQYKYLGVWFNTRKFDFLATTQAYLVEQANKALFQVYKLAGPAVGKLSPPLAFKMFDTQILPILEYGSETWMGSKAVDVIEKFHLKFLKSTLNVRTQTNTEAVYAETGRLPLYIRHQIKALKFWIRLLYLPENYPVKQAYNTLKYFDTLGQKNWCTKIRKILENIGYSNLWEEQSPDDCNSSLHDMQKNLESSFKDKSMNKIQKLGGNGKLTTYRIFKNQFHTEPYLWDIKDQRYRATLTRFHLSAHNLAVETGRHAKPKIPRCNRICEKCDTGLVEDEFHFLMVCSKHSHNRQVLFDAIKPHIQNFETLEINEKFRKIMMCQEPLCLVPLGKFLYDGFSQDATRP